MSQRSQLLSQEELDMSQMGYGFAPESLNRGTIPSMQEPPESQHLKTGPALVYSVAEQPYLERGPDGGDDFDENKQAGRWVRGFLTCCAVWHIFTIVTFIIMLVGVSVGLNMFLYEVEYPGITHVIRKQMPAVEGGGSSIDLIDDAALLQRLSGSNSAKMQELIPVLQQRGQRPTAPAAAFVEFSVDHEGEVTQLEDHQPQAVAEWQSVSPAAEDYDEHGEAAPGSFLEVVAGRGPPRGGLPLTLPGAGNGKPGGKNGSSLQSLDDIVEMFEDMVPDDGNTNNPRGGRRGGGESCALTYLLGFASQEEHHPLVLFGSDIHSGLNAVFNDRNARIGAYLELVRLGKVDKQTWEQVLTRKLSADKMLAGMRSKRQAATAKTNLSPGPQRPPQQPQNSFLEFLEAGARPPVVPGAPQSSPRRPKQVKDLKNRDLAQCPVLQKFTPSTIGRPYALNITTVVFLFLAAVGLCHLSCCKCCACGTSRARFGKGWVPAIMLWLVVASELVIFGVRLGYPSASQVFPNILGEHVFKAFQEELEMVRDTLGLGTSVQAAGSEENVFREGFLGMARMNRIALGEIKNAWDPEPVKLDVSDRSRVRAARILYSIVGPDMDRMVTALGAFTDEDELLGALLGKDSTFLPAAAKAKAPAEGAISLDTQRQMNDLLGNNVLKQLLGPFERILEAASKSIVNFKNGGNPPVGMQVGLWKFEAGFIVMTLLTLVFLFVGIGIYGQWNPNKA